jgi:M6 family metalloprotease-like protein
MKRRAVARFHSLLVLIALMAMLVSVFAVEAATPPAADPVRESGSGQPESASDPGQATPVPPASDRFLLPGVPSSPLRVMVPTSDTVLQMKAQGMTSLADWFPQLDTAQSFAPGPRMALPFQGHPQAEGPYAAPPPTFKTLAILVQFTDDPAITTATFFDSLLFGTGTSKTVRSYYREVSYNQLDIVTVNLPSSLGWQTAPQTYAYYVNGNNCTGSYPHNCQKLTEDLAALVDPVVDFSQYDNNHDGYVDTVIIIHAGSGAEANGGNRNLIWSHSWWTYTNPVLDGVRIGSYTTEPEYWFSATPGTSDMTHGVYVHELGHAFGLPDLYDVDYTSSGIGNWSLMSGGSWNGYLGDTPAHPDAWSRTYLEFNPVTNVTNTYNLINLPNIEQNKTGSLYRVDTGQPNEYWLLENRQKIGSDHALPGSGLLIWHVDNNFGGDASNKNECKQTNNYLCAGLNKHFRVALEQADGLRNLEYNVNDGDPGDPFPGSSNNQTFDFTSNPNTSSYYAPGAPFTEVLNINSPGGTVTALIAHRVPWLSLPENNVVVDTSTPTFAWSPVTDAVAYELQADDNKSFANPEVDTTVASTSFTPASAIPDGRYYWHVRGINGSDEAGPWSAVWVVTIDSAPPGVPALNRPKDHTYSADATPSFAWKAVKGTSEYQLQVSADYAFGTALIDTMTTRRTYTAPVPLAYGDYYARVRAHDAGGNVSEWSAINTFTITILNSPQNAQHLTDDTPALKLAYAGSGAVYHIQVDEIGGDFSDPAFEYTGTSRVASPLTALSGGEYQWRAQVDLGGGWSVWTPLWTFTITPPTTTAPPLISPAKYATLDTTTPNFEWSAVDGGYVYQIQIDVNSGFRNPLQDVTLAPGVLTYTASPLPDGGRYYWRVRAVNSVGVAGAWSATWPFTLNRLARPVLTDPATRTKTTDNAPVLNWAAVDGATGYRIQIDDDRRFGSPNQTATVGATSYPAAALDDSRYYWRVQAINASGVGGLWSAVWNFTIDTTGPDAPVLNSPADLAGTTDTTPTFRWKGSGDAALYALQVATDAEFTALVVEAQPTSSFYTLPAGGALGYGQYYWRIQAQDALGSWGDWSTPFSFAITIMLNPKDGSTTTVTRPTFSWAAVSGAVEYHFQLSNEADFSSIADELYGTARSVQPTVDLDSGVYYWRVQMDTGGGYGAWMPAWMLTITPAKPGKPVLLEPANRALTNDNTPGFSWLAATHGRTYQIQIDDNRDFSSPEQDVTVGVSLLTYEAAPLPDGPYYWRMRAVNSDGAPGAWSARRTFTVDTVPPAVPDLLTPLDSAASTNRQLKLDWSDSEKGAHYELWLDPYPAFPLPPIENGTKSDYTAPTPLSRGIYFWRVQAYDQAGNPSGLSAVRSFEIIAGVTEAELPTETPTAEPTGEPTSEPPTAEPSEPPLPTVEPPQPPQPPVPTAESTEPPLPTLTLPVMNACDSDAGWQAKGVWRIARKAGYQGGACFADSTLRGYASTLTAQAWIDLRTAQRPELRFWQRMGLSGGDLVAVDISADGGQTWQPVYQQVGQMADWKQRAVDLSAYRGLVVQIRFRLDTRGHVPGGQSTRGWWVDELIIQEALATPPTPKPTQPPVPTAEPTEPTEPPAPTVEPTELPIPTVAPTAEPTEPPTPEPTQEPPADNAGQ